MILSQRLVNGRKILSLFIEVPMYKARRRRKPRTRKRREKDRKSKQEKKRSTEQPAPAQPDSPLGWFDQTIPLPSASQPRRVARGRRSLAANSPCPTVSRDDEASDVESSEDGTSDEESKKREEKLSFEESKKFVKLFEEELLKMEEKLMIWLNNKLDETSMELGTALMECQSK